MNQPAARNNMLDWLRRTLAPPSRATDSHTSAANASTSGNWILAERLYRAILDEQSDDTEALYGWGNALYQLDRTEEALSPLESAVARAPSNASYHYKLANALKDLGRLTAAKNHYEQALLLAPNHAQARNNLGVVLEMMGETDQAISAYRLALEKDVLLIPAHRNLSNLLHQTATTTEALDACLAWLRIYPDSAEAWCQLGDNYRRLGRNREALDALQHGLSIAPNSALLLNALGNHFDSENKLDEAVDAYRCASIAAPDQSKAQANLANALLRRGEVEDAIHHFRAAVRLDPNNEQASRLLLMAILYQPMSNEHFFEEHRAIAKHFVPKTFPIAKQGNPRPEHEKLRIGYISSDFRQHPVALNIQPIIESHDRSHFEIFLYAHVEEPDQMTAWFQTHCDKWSPVHLLNDHAAARLIADDKIDILVFLAGRFDRNRPWIAQYRPAPVQISMHDPATSGLDEMDYLISDRILSPNNTLELFTERIARLPTFYLHEAIPNSPTVTALPAKQCEQITFGSFNNPAKLSADTVAIWSRILKTIPNSRLVLKYWGAFSVNSIRGRYQAAFAKHGISPDRIILRGEALARESHLREYAELDIALDPFPFSGSTTTFEALWMGIPVITLLGDRMVSRWSAAMMSKVGLSHLIASDEDKYVQIAVDLASDLESLDQLRQSLRNRVATSPLCAVHRRTHQLERLFRCMWKRFRDQVQPV